MTEQKLETSYNEVKEALEQLGIGSYESTVYLFIATHVPMSASQIANDLEFDRSKVYRMVDLLVQKGFVTTTIGNPRLCIITDCATAIDGLIREWENRFINGKKNKEKIVDFIEGSKTSKMSVEKQGSYISILTSRNAVYSYLCSNLSKCKSNVIIYTNAIDLTRMNYTDIPELLHKVSKTNTCTIVIDKDLNGISKKYKGCKVIKIRKQIEGRIIIIEDELVVMSSKFMNRDIQYKSISDISLSIKEPQVISNMQYFMKLVLG